jgi:SEC-C motif
MPSVPAFCDTCSTVFNSGFFVENSTNISFSGNRSGPCPKCGGMGHIPDGVFNFIGNTIEILSAPERTISELSRLAQIFRDAKANSETKEQVASRIEKEIPALSKLAKLLPENRAELYGFLALVLAAAQFFNEPSQLSPTSTTVNVTQVIQQAMVESPRVQGTARSATANKPGRNDLCSCKSGAKYKKCCGVLK